MALCGEGFVAKNASIVRVYLPIRRPRYCRPMRKARESSMALVFWRLALALVLSFCAIAVIAPRPAPAADVTVFLDQAKLMQLPDQVATIVIGNPLIADASLQPGGFVV